MFKIKDNNVLEDSIRFLKNFSNISSYKEAVDVVLSELKDKQINELMLENGKLKQEADKDYTNIYIKGFEDGKEQLNNLVNRYKQEISNLHKEKENLIKYLETQIKKCGLIRNEHIQGCDWKAIIKIYNTKTATYKEILEVVKEKKYD